MLMLIRLAQEPGAEQPLRCFEAGPAPQIFPLSSERSSRFSRGMSTVDRRDLDSLTRITSFALVGEFQISYHEAEALFTHSSSDDVTQLCA